MSWGPAPPPAAWRRGLGRGLSSIQAPLPPRVMWEGRLCPSVLLPRPAFLGLTLLSERGSGRGERGVGAPLPR